MKNKTGSKFVILTSQRSGSAWVISILNKLDNTTAYGELFIARERKPKDKETWDSDYAYPRYIEEKSKKISIRPFSVFSYMNTLYRNSGHLGFKLMYGQLKKYPEILAYLTCKRIKVIHLVRKNHLDVIVSFAIKNQIKRAHPTSGEEVPDSIKIDLNPDTLIARMKKLRRNVSIARKMLKWSFLPHMEIAYEDLLEDTSNYKYISDFLSIDLQTDNFESHLVKIRKGDHKDVIENYTEVKELLQGSPFEDMIH
ncbi:sulfotransferase domain-containing protein [Planctomycetota bacterium]